MKASSEHREYILRIVRDRSTDELTAMLAAGGDSTPEARSAARVVLRERGVSVDGVAGETQGAEAERTRWEMLAVILLLFAILDFVVTGASSESPYQVLTFLALPPLYVICGLIVGFVANSRAGVGASLCVLLPVRILCLQVTINACRFPPDQQALMLLGVTQVALPLVCAAVPALIAAEARRDRQAAKAGPGKTPDNAGSSPPTPGQPEQRPPGSG